MTSVFKSVGAPKSLVEQTIEYMTKRKFIPGGRYLYASGRQFHQVNNCLLMKAEDSREGWSEHMQKSAMGLMTGAGIGTDYSYIRSEGKLIRKTGATRQANSSMVVSRALTAESPRRRKGAGSQPPPILPIVDAL